MTKIFNPLGRTMQRRDFLKVAGASVAVAALPAAVRGADPVKVLAVVVGAGSPACRSTCSTPRIRASRSNS